MGLPSPIFWSHRWSLLGYRPSNRWDALLMKLVDSLVVHTLSSYQCLNRCNFRCVYCLPEHGIQWTPKSDILSYEENSRIVHVFARTKDSPTGGEPTMRADICTLIASLCQIEGSRSEYDNQWVYTSQNGSATLWCGTWKLNISLDTVDAISSKNEQRFSIEPVLRGIKRQKWLFLKINAQSLMESTRILSFHFSTSVLREYRASIYQYMPLKHDGINV